MSEQANSLSSKLTILGGGPAGLALAYYARKRGIDFALYEANSEVGGFCRTWNHGDFYYDTGAHRLHDEFPEVTKEIVGMLGTDIRKISVPSQIWSHGQYVDFPLSPLNTLLALGPFTCVKAAVEILLARFTSPKRGHDNFEAHALRKYGKTIAERFLLNYSEKLWGRPCHNLSPAISGKRLKGLNLRTFIKEAVFGKESKTEHLDGAFYYPVKGYGMIVEKLASEAGRERIHLDSKITRIRWEPGRITSIERNGEEALPVSEVANTLPLTLLLKMMDPPPPPEILKVAESLHYRHLLLVVILVDKPTITANATVYFPDKEFPFTRVYEPRNRSERMSPKGKTSLVVELPTQTGDRYWQQDGPEVTKIVVDKLIGIGWFTREQVVHSFMKRMPFAYPVLEKDYEATIEKVMSFFDQFENLHFSGRNGKFMYTHLHDMMVYGKEITEKIAHRGSEISGKAAGTSSRDSEIMNLNGNGSKNPDQRGVTLPAESFAERLTKHSRISWENLSIPEVPSPPFLILFINSICNMKCEHCFYWEQLNKKDDLSFEEIVALSEDLGRIENLNLSGGEPFLRKEFAAVCRQFIRRNGVKEIYVPTNGYYTERTIDALREVLQERSLRLMAIELSLDGMPEFHDKFRKTKNSFKKAMQTYDALAELQKEDSRLQIHSISTATEGNMEEIKKLTTFLYDRCPRMAHHNLAIIRGDRKNPTLRGPALEDYRRLYDYIRMLWADREESRYGSIVEPMLQWAKLKGAEMKQQFVPCRAGVLSAVIHANGDVGVCEQRPPIGNLRKQSFREIWRSHVAKEIRRSIRCKECYCTNEIFMWPSIVYQPVQLAKSMVGAKVWKKVRRLEAGERVDYAESAAILKRSE